MSFALRAFAASTLEKSKNWYEKALYEESMNSADVPRYIKLWKVIKAKKDELRVIGTYIIYICIMTFWACKTFKGWLLIDGLYFAISSCSTGGLWAIPLDASDNNYAIGLEIMHVLFSPYFRLFV